MNVLSIPLNVDKFGCWDKVIGILEYIFGPKHVMEQRIVLDLAKEGLYLNKDWSGYGCDGETN